ncbi:MAG TPA: acyl carrier protein [Phycisphaerae bacterium]|nr:acyl carrier protein [Phycisphaerae bacterium]
MSKSTRDELRQYLFGTLMPMDKERWPADQSNLMDHGLDSLRLMQMLVFVEEKLKVRLPDEEVTPERIESVDSITEWIESRRR